MLSKEKNILYLDDFLTFDNNFPFDLKEDYNFNDIYKLEGFIKDDIIYSELYNKFHTNLMGYENINDLIPITPESIKRNKNKKINDIYKPKKIRGNGNLREGYCNQCDLWFKLKTSSYWYHMNYKHGINSKGIKYPEPEIRYSEWEIEGFCEVCNDWIILGHKKSKKSIKFGWFKHWQKIHSSK